MSSLFRLNASIRLEGSASRELADLVQAEYLAVHPSTTVVTRNVGLEPLPATLWAEQLGANHTPDESRTPAQRETLATTAALADEVIDAEALLIATPLYNFGISQHLRTWIDVLLAEPRLGSQTAREHIGGKPTTLVIVRGGAYGAGTPREGGTTPLTT